MTPPLFLSELLMVPGGAGAGTLDESLDPGLQTGMAL